MAQWVEAGAAKESKVAIFCDVADEIWDELPEDACLGDEAAKVFLEAQTAVRILKCLMNPVVTESSDLDILEELKGLEQCALRTAGDPSPMQVIGQSVRAGSGEHWQMKLKYMSKHIAGLQEHGPAIQKALAQAVKLPAMPSEMVARSLTELVKKLLVMARSAPARK